jgi:alpha-amylase
MKNKIQKKQFALCKKIRLSIKPKEKQKDFKKTFNFCITKSKLLLLCIVAFSVILTSCSNAGQSNKVSDGYRNYYEIFVRSFYDKNADGLGDLAGVTAKLDYISDDLGADGIWLMPIMPSPSYHKYDVTDYYTIDPQYGTLADFDKLISEAHKRDVKVIIDLVLNHTSNLHPWFDAAVKALWAGTESKYIGYYNFTLDDIGQGYSKITDKYYYECRFVSGMPDLNLDNQDLRSELIKIARFWMDRGVDGFRLDAVTSFYTGDQPKNIEFLKWFNTNVKTYKSDAYLVGEAWSDSGIIAEYYKSGVDSFFNFPLAQATGLLVSTINNKAGNTYAKELYDWNLLIAEKNPVAKDAPFISNHDNGRSAGYLMRNLQKEKMAASLYLLAPGNPFIYYGEELGMTGSGIDENKRLPMFWSQTDKKGTPFPPPNYTQTIEGIKGADEQIKDSESLINHYQKILSIKDKLPGIARGKIEYFDTALDGVAKYSVTYKEKRIYIVHNLTAKQQQIAINDEETGRLSIYDYLATEDGNPKLSDKNLTIPPMSTVIIT